MTTILVYPKLTLHPDWIECKFWMKNRIEKYTIMVYNTREVRKCLMSWTNTLRLTTWNLLNTHNTA